MKNDKIVNQIKNTIWQKSFTRRVTVRWGENFLLCTLNSKKFFGLKFPDHLLLAKDEIGYAYLNKVQLDKFLESLLGKLYNSSFYRLYEKRASSFLKGFLKFTKSIASLNLRTLNSKGLLNLYERFIKQEDIFTNFLWIIFVIDDYFSQELKAYLKNYLKTIRGENKFDEYFKIVLSPDKKSAVFAHTIDILKVAGEIRSKKIKGKEIERRIKDLELKYSYFPILNFDEKFFDKNYFRHAINKILQNKEEPDQEIRRINNQFRQNKIQYQKIIKTLKSNSRLFKLVDACHKIAYYRDYRNDIRRESYFHVKQLYQEIADRLKINLTDLLFLTRQEIRESIIKVKLTISKKEIKKRRKYYALTLLNTEIYHIFNHQKIAQLFKIIEPDVLVKNFIKGIGANPGMAKGRVRIVLNTQKDSLRFKEGEILVTPMTNLDFVSLIAKAAAIITDEGGLLCHAAIISREMDKPCLVGTKIATKVLKDGDLVAVDANKGVVRVLKHEIINSKSRPITTL